MNKSAIDIGNPSNGRYTLAQIEMMKRIKDFDSFRMFIKEEKDSRASWSDEKEKAFNDRINDLMEKNPEFKEKYTAYCKEIETRRKRAQRAISLDDKDKAQNQIRKRQAEQKLIANSKKTAIKRAGKFEI